MNLVVAIMAGGAGTRFWPASTERRPKQFLALAGERTLLQQSYDRARAMTDRILVVTNAAFTGLVHEQLPELGALDVIGEPQRKDTAAAAVLATCVAEKRWPDCTLAILTADQVITPTDKFAQTVKSAAAHAGHALYTIGIPPTFPSTGFGYLKLGADVLSDENGGVVHRIVDRFVEKPDLVTAETFVKSGEYLWNAGMFVWRTRTALEAMREHLPVHLEAIQHAVEHAKPLDDAFARVPKVSIDKGMMEKAAHVRCVAATFAWNDVGSFPAAADHLPHDADGNAHHGRVVAKDAHRNVVWCEDPHELVAVIGLDDVVVVRAGKRTLIAPRSRSEDIKKLVDGLDAKDRE